MYFWQLGVEAEKSTTNTEENSADSKRYYSASDYFRSITYNLSTSEFGNPTQHARIARTRQGARSTNGTRSRARRDDE
jgi:hypothetical protein